MKTDMNHLRQTHAHSYQRAGSTPPGGALEASSTRYTCTMHPEVVSGAPGKCPKCGMTLVPMLKAMARLDALFRDAGAINRMRDIDTVEVDKADTLRFTRFLISITNHAGTAALKQEFNPYKQAYGKEQHHEN